MAQGSTRVTTIRQEVLKADPKFQQQSNYPIEYEFSNGRIFRGYYQERGAYTPPSP